MEKLLSVLSVWGPIITSGLEDFLEVMGIINAATDEGRDLTDDEVATIDARMRASEDRWADVLAEIRGADEETAAE